MPIVRQGCCNTNPAGLFDPYPVEPRWNSPECPVMRFGTQNGFGVEPPPCVFALKTVRFAPDSRTDGSKPYPPPYGRRFVERDCAAMGNARTDVLHRMGNRMWRIVRWRIVRGFIVHAQ
jgi:hypothetical protein